MKKYHYTARQVAALRERNSDARAYNRAQSYAHVAGAVFDLVKIAVAVTLFVLGCGWLGLAPTSLWAVLGFLAAALALTYWDTGVLVWAFDVKDRLWLACQPAEPVPFPQVDGDMPEVQIVPPGRDERWAREYDETGGLGYDHWDAVRRGAGTAG